MSKYTEILKLKKMLDDARIPYENFTDDFFHTKERMKNSYTINPDSYPAYQLRLNKDIDVIQHYGSYGESQDLLEIMGALTVEEYEGDSVLGYLTAEEVFKRFKYCYEHGTRFYKE